MPKGFCGSTLRPRHDRATARNAIARLGLAGDEKAVTSEKVLQEVQRMAAEPWTSAVTSCLTSYSCDTEDLVSGQVTRPRPILFQLIVARALVTLADA